MQGYKPVQAEVVALPLVALCPLVFGFDFGLAFAFGADFGAAFTFAGVFGLALTFGFASRFGSADGAGRCSWTDTALTTGFAAFEPW